MDGRLQGLGVLITRPALQSEILCDRIIQLGGRPISLPALEIRPLLPAPKLTSGQDIVLFISPNAVRFGLPLLRLDAPLPLVGAVGEGTAACLRAKGIEVGIVPEQRWDSEGLLQHPLLQQLSDKQILIVRGQGGRDLLLESLMARGAQVTYAEVYQRCLPDIDPSPILQRWQEQIHLVYASSNQILDNLFTLLGSMGAEHLRQTPLLMVSQRGVEHARSLGCKQVFQATGAGDDAAISAMLAWVENGNLARYSNG